MIPSAPAPLDADVAVIGAGIVGLAVARELGRRDPRRRVVVLEQEGRVGAHQTSHSSGVLHAGVYYAPGSLKARMCVRGRERLEAYCAERGIAHVRCGKLVVARDRRELGALNELERRAHANGVPGLRRLEGATAIAAVEPHVTGAAALHSPTTGVVDFSAVARALAGDVRAAGGEVRLAAEVRAIRRERGPEGLRVVLDGPGGTVRVRRIVGCAGLWSDRLAALDGAAADPRIVPFRGAYLRLRPEARHLVRGLVYPVPDPALPFLGVHLTRTVGGEVWLGPTALLVGARDAYRLATVRGRDVAETLRWPGTWRLARRHWRTALGELALASDRRRFVAACRAYVPELRVADVDGEGEVPSGVRAQAVGRDGTLVDDFVLERTPSGIHVRNAPSPAATSSLALAEQICDRVDATVG